ncbi:hypothetical protein [Streptomyces sp. KL116D]|uniref:hypothetical protein n=1 Tax=Streptomyces sp. KL116D TaxID=3045152 RepID=UPI00355656FD
MDCGREEPARSGTAALAARHLLGAVLVAAFANSPMLAAVRPAGESARQVLWDGGSARALGRTRRATRSRARAWALRHVLVYALVMCVRSAERRGTAPDGLTFRSGSRGRAAAARTRS